MPVSVHVAAVVISLVKKKETELAESSLYDLYWIFNKFITPFFTGKDLTKLRKQNYTEWQTNLWATKNTKNNEYFSQKYLTKIRVTLNTFLEWVEETYELPNLLKSIKKPKRRESKKEMKVWSLDEFIKFTNVVDDYLWRTFFMFLFYTGCRVGEVIALTEDDIVGNTVVINKSYTRKTLNTEDKCIISPPKTASSNRGVIMPDILTEQIKEFIIYKRNNNISPRFLFGGDVPIKQRTYQRKFDSFTIAADLPKIRIHDLRHSHATMLINQGVPITLISKRLGHSSIKMTFDTYSHCYDTSDSEAIDKLNSVITDKIKQ